MTSLTLLQPSSDRVKPKFNILIHRLQYFNVVLAHLTYISQSDSLVGYCAMWSHTSRPTFQRHLLLPSLGDLDSKHL
jgi:hypothetical protein